MKMFGYHATIDCFEKLKKDAEGAIRYLAPLGVTHLILDINNNFRFRTHPEISGSDITAEQLREISTRLREAGIEVIPLYNCIGHQGWKSRNPLLLAYPELDEAPHIPDDKLIAPVWEREGHKWLSTYTPAWCCNEPKIFDIVLPAIDELVEATQCKTVHLGMDEVFLFGQCKRCEGMSPKELFRDSLLRFYRHFKEKGIEVMIWGDRLLDANRLIGEGAADRARYGKDFENVGTSACIDELPKDIIVCDWHYEKEDRYPSALELMSHGYRTFPSCWYKTEAAEAFWDASLSASDAVGGELLPGMLVTGWGICGLSDLFTLPEDQLSERDIAMRVTLPRVAQLMKKHFASASV